MESERIQGNMYFEAESTEERRALPSVCLSASGDSLKDH